MDWPEAVTPVQSLAERRIQKLPEAYIRPESERFKEKSVCSGNLPTINMNELRRGPSARRQTMKEINEACKEWGFFQVINHGISGDLLREVLQVSRSFFQLPMEEKLKYANDPLTYVGYGSRLGVQKGTILDWGDYFFHHYLPECLREEHRWPSYPTPYRQVMKKYCEAVMGLTETILEIFEENLGLKKESLKQAFGGSIEECVRLNFYPPCPEPHLTFGVSPHSDPGGLTILVQNEVDGLHVRKDDRWVAVKYIADALVVNIGDQIEILTDGKYKSVEHRGAVTHDRERMSVVVFCNPRGEKTISPLPEFSNEFSEGRTSNSDRRRYAAMTFNEYRRFIRTGGTNGKTYILCQRP